MRAVPGGREADRLWEHRGQPRSRDAVQPLVPPVVDRHAEPLDGGRGVLHLVRLLLERHAAHEIGGARLEGERFVLVGGGLRGGWRRDKGTEGERREDAARVTVERMMHGLLRSKG